MIIIDTALALCEENRNLVRVGMIGAGFMARGISNQIANSTPGMKLVAIYSRNVCKASECYIEAGISPEHIRTVDTKAALERAISDGHYAVTDNPMLLCEAGNIDVLLEVTGAVEFGARVTMHAIRNGKHMILINAELDATVGPILKVYADVAGVMLTGCDGDQPGLEMNLYRYVKSIGLTPLLCGNVKGLQDAYRNPTTQAGFAAKWGQNPYTVTSFADGTKISFEQALVANATGMRVAKRGMLGYPHDGHVDELTTMFDIDMLKAHGGIVDYVLGAKPAGGIFVLGAIDDPKQKKCLKYYKMGDGPLYSFYLPYHICHFEIPLSVARVVLLKDYIISPLGAPVVEVITLAKTDLNQGDVIDRLGGYTTYGQCENADVAELEHLLPIGLAEGCTLKRAVVKDQALTYDDVELPPGRLIDQLREEQRAYFDKKIPKFGNIQSMRCRNK